MVEKESSGEMGYLYTRLEGGRLDEMGLNGDMKCLYTRVKRVLDPRIEPR